MKQVVSLSLSLSLRMNIMHLSLPPSSLPLSHSLFASILPSLVVLKRHQFTPWDLSRAKAHVGNFSKCRPDQIASRFGNIASAEGKSFCQSDKNTLLNGHESLILIPPCVLWISSLFYPSCISVPFIYPSLLCLYIVLLFICTP